MSSPPPARCTFYIVLRQRTCKFEVRAGSAEPFCEYHSTVDADGVRRVPCPVDPSHTVRENQLSKHVPRCPHAKVLKRVHEAAAVCTVKDVNRGGSDDEQHGIDEHMATLKGRELAALLTTTEWASLVATIEAAAATTADVASQWWNGPAEPPCPPECLPWVNPEGGLLQQQRTEDGEGGKLFFSQYKHNAQQAAIAYHMRRVGLLPDVRGRCYVEAGAGKGYLTLLVSEVYKAEQFVLLDQGKGGRNKADKGLKGHKRLVVDLADVVLEKVLDEKELQQTKLVVIGKHLCGAATDMALRAYQRALTHCVGLAIAPCCRHRCAWKTFVGKAYFRQLGLGQREFQLMAWMCSWAVCGPPTEAEHEHEEDGQEEPDEKGNFLAGLSRERRQQLGLHCRHLIDEGRRQSLGALSSLVSYVPSAISLENTLLLSTVQQS